MSAGSRTSLLLRSKAGSGTPARSSASRQDIAGGKSANAGRAQASELPLASHARFAPLQGPRLVRSSQRKWVRVTSQWPAPHGALRQAEQLPHRHMRGSLMGLRG